MVVHPGIFQSPVWWNLCYQHAVVSVYFRLTCFHLCGGMCVGITRNYPAENIPTQTWLWKQVCCPLFEVTILLCGCIFSITFAIAQVPCSDEMYTSPYPPHCSEQEKLQCSDLLLYILQGHDNLHIHIIRYASFQHDEYHYSLRFLLDIELFDVS